METRLNNVDILVLGNNPLARTIMRVLAKYTDLTLFTENNIEPNIPDLIVLTYHDPFDCRDVIHSLPEKYSDVKKVYISQYISAIPIGIMFDANVINIVSTDITGDVLHEMLLSIGVSPTQTISRKFLTRFINKYYWYLLPDDLSLKETIALSAKVRGYSYARIQRTLNMSRRRFNMLWFNAFRKTGLTTERSHTIHSIVKYGGVIPGLKYKKYVIPKYRKYSKGYFLLPQVHIIDEK